MPKRLWLDIETRSRQPLKQVGVYRYVQCPDFRILMAGWTDDPERPVEVALSNEEIHEIPGLWSPNVIKVAHNATFERVCFSAHLGMPVGEFISPYEYHDTQAVAGERGWPQKLENLGRALDGEKKDTAGTRLINLFCKPVASGKRKGQWNGPETHPLEWMDFIDYMVQDVVTLVDVDRRLGDHITDIERRVFLADQIINDRGIRIDLDLARAAVDASDANSAEQTARVIELTGMENPNSVVQFTKWAKEQGLPLENMQKDSVTEILKSPDLEPDYREVFELRQELALAAAKKFGAALAMETGDGRLRGTLAFYGAHTGRWAGRGTQVQNLPRHAIELNEEQRAEVAMRKDLGLPVNELIAEYLEANTEMYIDMLLLTGRMSSDDLKRLVRPLFSGPFTVVDYAAIEARVIAWLAAEEWALRAFRAGRDIYVETAERMSTPTHPLDRSQGKVAVLALGYAGAVNSLRAMGAEGNDAELMVLVKQWRKANARIVRLWNRLESAWADTGHVGNLLSVTHSQDAMGLAVHLHLPSGRSISYHGVKWERYKVKDPVTGKPKTKEGWRYADPKNPFNPNMRIGTYGGRLAENVTQAVARDVMAEALVRLEDAGYRVVAHVHDEIIIEGIHDVEEISRIMCQLPSWATGLPVDGEGFTCTRYRKG